MRYLGTQVDIHSGGADLIFPHHTCEIAQAEHFSGVTPFVRYWFHIAMVRLDGQKMSKSLGNMLFVRELLKTYSADAIRVYLLSHHYRAGWDADNATPDLQKAEAMVTHWRNALALPSVTEHGSETLNPMPYQETFSLAMDDDLSTPRALEHLDELADAIANTSGDLQAAQTTLGTLAGVLGLRLSES